jgi:uncharacterized protein
LLAKGLGVITDGNPSSRRLEVGDHTFKKVISTEAELRAVLGWPSERAVRKVVSGLDVHCRAFISKSPFVLLSTADANGKADVSPKGDRPGFVLVLDDHTLLIPDRPGNRRADSLTNILQNPHAGLLFLVPGKGETLRVNGTARIVRDEGVLARMAVDGKAPTLAIAIDVVEAYIHCAKAMIRSSLWKPGTWGAPEDLPSIAQVLMDHARLTDCTVEEVEQSVKLAYEKALY